MTAGVSWLAVVPKLVSSAVLGFASSVVVDFVSSEIESDFDGDVVIVDVVVVVRAVVVSSAVVSSTVSQTSKNTPKQSTTASKVDTLGDLKRARNAINERLIRISVADFSANSDGAGKRSSSLNIRLSSYWDSPEHENSQKV